MVDASKVMNGRVPPQRGRPDMRRERLVTRGEGNGRPEPRSYEWRADERQLVADTARRLAGIRAQAARNRAAELDITPAEAEKLQRDARAAEVLSRRDQTLAAQAARLSRAGDGR